MPKNARKVTVKIYVVIIRNGGNMFTKEEIALAKRLPHYEIILYILTQESIRTGHPLEPFPLYQPRIFKEKFIWFFVVLRWKVVKPFVRYKSFFKGKTRREICATLNKWLS